MKLIIYFSIFGSNTFFVLASLIGYQYTEAESNLSYLVYTLVITTIVYMIVGYDLIKNRRKIPVILYVFPFIIIGSFLANVLINGINERPTTFFLYFLIWSMPAYFAGIYLSYANRVISFYKYLDVIMILTTLAVFFNAILNLWRGEYTSGLAGNSNQNLSYIAAFSFGLNLFLNFSHYPIERFKIFELSFYKKITFILLPIQFFSILVSGGRGGLVLAVSYIFLFFAFNRSFMQTIKLFSLIFIIYLLSSYLYTTGNEIFVNGFNRVFSYISKDGIDFNATSGRDYVYAEALNLFYEKPLFGYGIFGFLNVFDNPHNIILEILLGGGFFLLLVFLLLIFYVLYNSYEFYKADSSYIYIYVIALFPTVMLMFSGTYLVTPEFWFVSAYLLSTIKNGYINQSYIK